MIAVDTTRSARPLTAPRRPLVLLVDASDRESEAVQGVLAEVDARALRATDGPQALAMLDHIERAGGAVDLIILDYWIAGMTGPRLVSAIRARRRSRDVPILVHTVSRDPAHIAAAFDAGADDYVTRPIDPQILVRRLSVALDARRCRLRAAEHAVVSRERDALRAAFAEARRVHEGQFPALPVRWRGWHATGAVLPCSQFGGDLFDVIASRGDRRVAVVVDVCGHGVAAALVAIRVHGELRALLRTCTLEDSIAELNEFLCERSRGEYACAGLIELAGPRVRALNAGLPPIALVRGGDVLASFARSGAPPGLFAGEQYRADEVEVRAGDRLVVLSDGMTEPFGHIDDLSHCLAALGLCDGSGERPMPPDRLAARLANLTANADAPEADDATAVILEYLGDG